MKKPVETMLSVVTLTAVLAVAGGGLNGTPVLAAHPTPHTGQTTPQTAAQTCAANHNAVFGLSVPISHGACVGTIRSKGNSSVLYASLCSYVVAHGGTLSGIAVSRAPSFLDATTTARITTILSRVTMPSGGKFTSRGQCVSAFNTAKHRS